jgi:hypothetical protein
MRKLKLQIDALAVESFDTETTPPAAGTVEGRAWTPGCDSIRICKPDDPSYDPCTGDTGELACTGSCQYSACYNGQTCTCPSSPTTCAPDC